MKIVLGLTISVVITLGLIACSDQSSENAVDDQQTKGPTVALERPSDVDLVAFKVYHHAVYMVTTAI